MDFSFQEAKSWLSLSNDHMFQHFLLTAKNGHFCPYACVLGSFATDIELVIIVTPLAPNILDF